MSSITNDVARQIESCVNHWQPRLIKIAPETAHQKPSEDRWSLSEVIGHLVDSACNNHQRFVRAQSVPALTFPKYDQNEWVKAANYRECDWNALVNLWQLYNLMLAQLISNIPADLLQIPCTITPLETCTLQFLIEDYFSHLEHHFRVVEERFPA